MNARSTIQLLIITGMSGAGKTIAVKSLENLGFFCVDNLPPVLISKFAELIKQSEGKIERVALVIDLRGREFFDSLAASLDELEESGIAYQILFLDANNQTLVQRYKETRGRHPMAPDNSPLDGIEKERKLLEEIRARAHQIIDTTNLTATELKSKLVQRFSNVVISNSLSINLISFGFKYGIPIDADLVFDVRFLPNPHYVPELKPKTGCDAEVSQYVLQWTETQQFIQRLVDFLTFLLPHYEREGKSQLVIGIGCTGGKHRSVTIAEYLMDYYKSEYNCRVDHRDMGKDR